MKKLLLQMIVCGAALLPFSQIQAATYGGYAPGKKITLTVKTKISASLVGFSTKPKKVPVPSGIPDYKVGEKVVFTIGAKGQLTAKGGLSLPFVQKSSTAGANVYLIPPSQSRPQGDIAQIFKDTGGKAESCNLFFVRVKISGTRPTTTTVDYTLE